jgi:3-phosphoglycerate kinase
MGDFSNKIVLMRVDWNLSLTGKERSFKDINDISKILRSVTTIRTIFKRGAKNVHIITHQGRPGSSGFRSTEMHAKAVSKELKPYGIKVKYVGDFTEDLKSLENCLKNQKSGYVYVWDNIRKLEHETELFEGIDLFDTEIEDIRVFIEKKINDLHLVKLITNYCKPERTVYINDAFAAHHRVNHLSLGPLALFLKDKGYGFFYGPAFNDELAKINLLRREMNNTETNFFFGGAKIKDYMKLIPNLLNSYPDSNVFASGPLALALIKFGQGKNIGKKNHKLLKDVKGDLRNKLGEIYKKYKHRIHLPSTFMVIENGDLSNGKEVEKDVDSLKNSFVVDIGAKAIEDYEKILKVRHSSVNIINGGCGFHEGGFVNGTVKIFEHTMNNGCFVAIVGGDANLTWNMHVVDLGEPDVKSTAGKAFLNAVVHDELPLKKFMEM